MITRRNFTKLGISAASLAVSPFALTQVTSGLTPGVSEGADIRRIGRRPNGEYWGTGFEQIDMLSGNLNFSATVLNMGGRGAGAALMYSYNSQLWKADSNGLHAYGADLGFGYGWKLQAGSIAPQRKNSQIAGYAFVDGTGAEYPLTQSGSRWISLQGANVSWDPSSGILQFYDGSFWSMGCISGQNEADAGTRYPTLIQDSNGNRIILGYLPAVGERLRDTSARISYVEDARAVAGARGRRSYIFVYDASATPRLQSITSHVQTPESYRLSYGVQTVQSPFAVSGPAGGANLLLSFVDAAGVERAFQYNSHAELLQAQTEFGGAVSWTYRTFNFSQSRAIREVASRTVTYSPTSSQTDQFERPPSDGLGAVHGGAILKENGGPVVRSWTFVSDPNSSDGGLLISLLEPARSIAVTWARTAQGSPYVGARTITLDPGTPNETTGKTEFDRDAFGNLTEQRFFDYGNLAKPVRIYSYSYLNDPAYIAKGICNRLVSSSATDGAQTLALVQNHYDTTPLIDRSGVFEHDSHYGPGNTLRGNVTESFVGGVYRKTQYDVTGFMTSVVNSSGFRVALTPADGSNNTQIGLVIPNGNIKLATQTVTDSFGNTTITSANGATVRNSYDSIGRLISSTDADGGTTSFSYSAVPSTLVRTINGRWRKEIRSPFGRLARIERGDQSGTLAVIEQEFGPAPNAPLGRILKQSLPYAPGTAPAWMNFSYDGRGRATARDLARQGGATRLAYAGNTVTVTDPAGRWIHRAYNFRGDLAEVKTPSSGASPDSTSYSYNPVSKLAGVSMPRSEALQTRAFTYDVGGRTLTEAQAESGAKTRRFNADGTLADVTDAKGQRIVSSWDSYRRLISEQCFDAAGKLQQSQSVYYYYDSNPFDSSYSQNAEGRLAAMRWGDPAVVPGLITEMYSYSPAGRMTAKRVRVNRGQNDADLDLTAAYDSNGLLVSMQYPGNGPLAAFSYDGLGRPARLMSGSETVVTGASYNAANLLTGAKLRIAGSSGYLQETRSYDALSRVIQIAAAPEDASDLDWAPQFDSSYSYANDGRLSAETDNLTGATTSYSYDSLGRLAGAQDGNPASATAWAYDSFGNRVSQQGTAGGAPDRRATFNGATNQCSDGWAAFDSNGNLTKYGALQLSYDIKDKLTAVDGPGVGESLAYDPLGRCIWKRDASGAEELSFYDPMGKRIAAYALATDAHGMISLSLTDKILYFGTRVVQAGDQTVLTDRLRSVRAWGSRRNGAASTKYLPFGEEVQATSQTTKFLSFLRDSVTGLDDSGAGYYLSPMGRFTGPRHGSSLPDTELPGTWNRYAFAGNDPLNR